MGCDVFANDDEIACKAGGGKVIAAFPDVCLSPPTPPTGPVPVPYPDTSFSKDMKNGSRSVRIKRKEVMLKDKSFYKTSPLGDEAATRNLGAGVITHVITGKTYFRAWSMDVKIEGANVDRHTDVTTSNHASPVGNEQVPTPNMASMATPKKRKKQKCECCGGEPHSQSQRQGKDISEEEFYGLESFRPKHEQLNANDAAFLEELKKDPQCKHLLPNKKKNRRCSKYYPLDPKSNEKRRIDGQWEEYSRTYRDDWNRKRAKTPHLQIKPGEKVAHRVPRAAGGCPVGSGNLAPTKPECYDKEETLSRIQDSRMSVIQRRYFP